jgi:SAM-dependent methyltransferase
VGREGIVAKKGSVQDRDYVLGTHDEEIERLALQHRVWRGRALDAWRRAGITVGQTVLDIGCGPGFAALDLAEIVGPTGRIVALDRSRRFLDTLEAARRARGLEQITVHEIDFDEDSLPAVEADAAWSRWAFAFVQRPRELLARVAAALKPGGVLVAHEYMHYSTWRLTTRSPEFEEFVRTVIARWRVSGGEPDIGLELPAWLEALGFNLRSLTPIVDVVSPSSFVWQWPRTFVDVGVRRLVDLGDLSEEQARKIVTVFAAGEATPGARMVTPTVLEIIAVRGQRP